MADDSDSSSSENHTVEQNRSELLAHFQVMHTRQITKSQIAYHPSIVRRTVCSHGDTLIYDITFLVQTHKLPSDRTST